MGGMEGVNGKQESWCSMSLNKSPLVWHAQGDADEYCLLTQDGRWVIAFRMQGEKTTFEQQAILRHMVASANACREIDTPTLEDLGPDTTLAKMAARLLDQRERLVSTIDLCMHELAAWMRDHGDDLATQEAIESAKKTLAGIRGPWCCEKGREQSKPVCDECADINDGYQACLGVRNGGDDVQK